jgi:hypothetical protein
MIKNDVKPLFVAGPARAGTTLLSVILSNHPDISVAPENHIIPFLVRQWRRPMLGRRRLGRLRELTNTDVKFNALKQDMSEFITSVQKYEPGIDARKVCNDFFHCYAKQIGSAPCYVGQKKNFLEYPMGLRSLFPDARIVGIFRDPRATTFSATRKINGVDVAAAASRWQRRARNATLFASAYPDNYFEISYERLVESPDTVLKEVCSFLGLIYDPAMLTYYEKNHDYSQVLHGFENLHSLTAYAIQKTHIHAWRETMDARNIAEVEYICGDEMRLRGYKTSKNTTEILSSPRRLKLRAQYYLRKIKN